MRADVLELGIERRALVDEVDAALVSDFVQADVARARDAPGCPMDERDDGADRGHERGPHNETTPGVLHGPKRYPARQGCVSFSDS